MQILTRFAVIAVVALFLAACANRSYLRREEGFRPEGWASIVVLPFSGKGQFTDLATNIFTLQMVGQQHFVLMQPGEIKITLTKLGIAQSQNTLTVLEAQKVARHYNAQAILMGNIEAYNNGFTLNAFATVRLIDAATGQIIAAAHKPSGLLLANSEQQTVIAAVENVANDINRILSDLARKNVSTPTKRTRNGKF